MWPPLLLCLILYYNTKNFEICTTTGKTTISTVKWTQIPEIRTNQLTNAIQTLGIIYNQLGTNDQKISGTFTHYNQLSQKSTHNSSCKNGNSTIKYSINSPWKLDTERKRGNQPELKITNKVFTENCCYQIQLATAEPIYYQLCTKTDKNNISRFLKVDLVGVARTGKTVHPHYSRILQKTPLNLSTLNMNGQNFATELSERKLQKNQQVKNNFFRERMSNCENNQTLSGATEEIDLTNESNKPGTQKTDGSGKIVVKQSENPNQTPTKPATTNKPAKQRAPKKKSSQNNTMETGTSPSAAATEREMQFSEKLAPKEQENLEESVIRMQNECKTGPDLDHDYPINDD